MEQTCKAAPANNPTPSGPIPQIQPLLNYLADDQIAEVYRAYRLADEAHEGVVRKSGDAYITHPLAVAGILAELHMDHRTLMAAILHDTIEDTWVTKARLTDDFGNEVAELVDGVTKLDRVEFQSRQEQAAESFIKMILAMSRDIRVILIKLADRLHNMRTLGHMKRDKRRRIALETLEVYAPIAMRLGMHGFKEELEDLGFSQLHPLRHRVISEHLRRVSGSQRATIEHIASTIRQRLAEHGIEAEVQGRLKSPYGIYHKMQQSARRFTDIHDLMGFRLVVDQVDDCYRALGVVHGIYSPISGRFKDYIAVPKSNGYQSIHTGLLGPDAFPVEIQIRTTDMEKIAESGIAAHWLYKTDSDGLKSTQQRARDWLTSLLDIQSQAGNSIEFLENVKVDLFPNEIYVFTPKGNILQLPKKSTVVDFAYSVHTDVGNHCVAARIDHQLAPLHSELESGQTVEIITAASAKPNPDWLEFVVTSKARTGVRHFLKNLEYEDSVLLGHRMLDRALDSLGSYLDTVPQKSLDNLLKEYRLERLEDLLADIAMGNRMAMLVARKLLPAGNEQTQRRPEALTIKGTEGRVVTFSRCCHPIPGDPIMGFLSAGRGIVIHTTSCHNVPELKKSPERCLEVLWDREVEGGYLVPLRVRVHNKPGVLATVAAIIAEADSNIELVEYIERDPEYATLRFALIVRGRVHLARIMRRVRRDSTVLKVQRHSE